MLFQKISILPPTERISWGGGGWGMGFGRPKKLKKCLKLSWKFQRGGRSQKNQFHGGRHGYFMNNTINHKIMTSQCKLLFSHRTDKMQPWGPSISSILQLLQAPLTSMNHLNNIKNIFNLKFYKPANRSAKQPFSSFSCFFLFPLICSSIKIPLN